MAKLTAQQWLDKWKRNLDSAGQSIAQGVDAVTVAPGQAAAAAKDRYVAGVTASADTWAQNTAKVTLQQWKDAMKTKGVQRIATGTAQAVQTKQANVAAMLSAVDAAVAVTNQTPRGSLEQNIQRAAIFAREMAARAPKRQK